MLSPLAVTSRPNLIIGCGYLGRRVANRWLAAGRAVAALTRRNSDALRALWIQPFVGDVLDRGTLGALPPSATTLYAVGLDRTAGASMHEVYVNGLSNVLDTLPRADRFIYVSSTSVYGQSDGSFVDENSPTEPVEESGQVVLEAERILRAKRPDAIILRLAGIYGPNRLLRRKTQVMHGEPIGGAPQRWLNLIQVDDGAAAVLAAEDRGNPGETYNIVDGEPVDRRDFYGLLAELVGAAPPVFQARPEPNANNRRVRNLNAVSSLGWRPQYPSYREGLPHALAESTW